MKKYVDIKDGVVVTVFAGPQDPADKYGYAEIEETDPRWIAYEANLAWIPYQASAQSALDKTDIVALRCWKAGVNFPPAWQSFTKALRDIVRAASGDAPKALPEPPPYPEGT